MKKNICILICFLLTSIMSVAQSREISIYGLGGMSNLNYKFDAGKVGSGFGGGIGITYTCNLNTTFGLTTGLELTSYNGKVASDGFSEQYTAFDDIGDEFLFRYSVTGYTEKQHATMLAIPLMALYSIPVVALKPKAIVFAAGLKFGIPLNATATLNPGTISTSGYYAYEDREYIDNLPQHGFVTGLSAPTTKNDVKLGFTVMASIEAGMHFTLNEKTGLYTGLFLDYGLNDARKTKSSHVVEYQSQLKYNSLLNTAMVDKMKLFSIGVKVGVKIRK